jgi:hypothetical protein
MNEIIQAFEDFIDVEVCPVRDLPVRQRFLRRGERWKDQESRIIDLEYLQAFPGILHHFFLNCGKVFMHDYPYVYYV